MKMHDALNRLCKWRMVFAGWQLGTRAKGDPECDAVRDHREATLIQRVELSAVTALLMRKGIITAAEYDAQVIAQCDDMHAMLERKFPGFTATEHGMAMDVAKAHETTVAWRP